MAITHRALGRRCWRATPPAFRFCFRQPLRICHTEARVRPTEQTQVVEAHIFRASTTFFESVSYLCGPGTHRLVPLSSHPPGRPPRPLRASAVELRAKIPAKVSAITIATNFVFISFTSLLTVNSAFSKPLDDVWSKACATIPTRAHAETHFAPKSLQYRTLQSSPPNFSASRKLPWKNSWGFPPENFPMSGANQPAKWLPTRQS